jgi:hypothetical protein
MPIASSLPKKSFMFLSDFNSAIIHFLGGLCYMELRCKSDPSASDHSRDAIAHAIPAC